MKAGDIVAVVEDTYYDGSIAAGATGMVLSVSPVSHATMNGGGFDAWVRLDAPSPDLLRPTVILRTTQLRPVCAATHYFLNNGRRCPARVYRDDLCEDHYWKTLEALAEGFRERHIGKEM